MFRIKAVGKNRLTWPRIRARFELVDEEPHFVLDLEVNGFKKECLMDTGSPISIMPQFLRDKVGPNKFDTTPNKRNFVDVNNNPIKIGKMYFTDVKILGIEVELIW